MISNLLIITILLSVTNRNIIILYKQKNIRFLGVTGDITS